MFQVLKNGRKIGAPVTGDKAQERVAQLKLRQRLGESAIFSIAAVS